MVWNSLADAAGRAIPRVVLATLVLTGIAACGSGVSVTGAWQDESHRPVAFERVLVVGISPNSRLRRNFELALGDAITARGTKAFAAVQTAQWKPKLDREIVTSMVQATGADAVLVTRLASRKVTATETAARTGVKTRQPTNLHGGTGLVEFFSLEYQEYEEPAELSAQSTAIVETAVYDARDGGRLIYTVTTTASFRDDQDDVVDAVTGAIAGELRKAGLVR